MIPMIVENGLVLSQKNTWRGQTLFSRNLKSTGDRNLGAADGKVECIKHIFEIEKAFAIEENVTAARNTLVLVVEGNIVCL